MASYDYNFKIMTLGDADTPKTSFTKRYCYNLFNPSERLTFGVDFHVKTIDLHGKRIKLQIWDIGGEERFRFLLPTYFLEANAAFLLYNITNPSTLEHLPDWIRIVREKAGDIPIILVGAKAHLEQIRAVSREEGILAAKKYNLSGFIEVSSKTGQNVEKAFELIIAILLEKYSTEITKTSRNHSRTEREKYLKGCPVCGSSKIKKKTQREFYYKPRKWTDGPHMWDPIVLPFIKDRVSIFRYMFRCRQCGYVWYKPSALTPRLQLEKDQEEKTFCQYCGMELTKEEEYAHSCKKKPKT